MLVGPSSQPSMLMSDRRARRPSGVRRYAAAHPPPRHHRDGAAGGAPMGPMIALTCSNPRRYTLRCPPRVCPHFPQSGR